MALPVVIPNTFANANASIPLSQLDNNFSTVAVAINGIANGVEALANVNITGGSIANASLSNVSISSGNVTINVANVTTLDATNIEVTNIKAKDGTASATIADSTGVMTIGSSVLTTADINGGTIDGTAIGGSTPAAGAFTTLASTGLSVVNSTAALLRAKIEASNAAAQQVDFEFKNSGGSTYIGQDAAGNSFIDARGALSSITFGYSGAVVTTISSTGLTMASGMSIRGANNLTLNATTGNSVIAQVNNSTVGAFSSTGLSVTGTLSSTGNFTVNTDRVVFTHTAPANSLYLAASGNLGLGVSTPSTKLHLLDTGPVYIQMTDAGDGASRVGQNGTALTFGVDGADGSTERMRIDASGNVGIGVTPSAWESTCKMLQLGAVGIVGRANSGQTQLGFNYFINSSGQYVYIQSLNATRYEQISGEHRWFNAPSGTAGNTITFTQAMTLDASGNVGIGTSSPGVALDILSATPQIKLVGTGTTSEVRINSAFGAANVGSIGTVGASPFMLFTNNTERMRISSAGGVSIGSTTDPGAENLYTKGVIYTGASQNAGIENAYNGALAADANLDLPKHIRGGIVVIRDNSSGGTALAIVDEATGVTIVSDPSAILSTTDPGSGGNKFWLQSNSGSAYTRITNRFSVSKAVGFSALASIMV